VTARPAQIVATVLIALVAVTVLATPLCAATVCQGDMRSAMASMGCSDDSGARMQSCDHVMTPISIAATTQSPVADSHMAAISVTPLALAPVRHISVVAQLDEPPRPPSLAPLRI
jgi:hypothetical protein